MDYEKKYKALVEAVKTLKEANPSDEGIQDWINDSVPELQESEDERIRKRLLFDFEALGKIEWGGLKVNEICIWLEKQGEQNPAWSEEDKKMFVNIKACLRNANKDYSREVEWLKSIRPQNH